MAKFTKFLAGTLVTAAAAVCGVAVYKKFQEKNAANDEEFDDFDDDDFDDDFEDLDVENRNYTSIPADAVVAAEDDETETVETTEKEEKTEAADTTEAADSATNTASDTTTTTTDTYSSNYSSNSYKKDDYSMDNTFYSRSSY